MVYFPASIPAIIDLSTLKCDGLHSQWFNPQTGAFSPSQAVTGQEFQPPQPETASEMHDWVLVIAAS